MLIKGITLHVTVCQKRFALRRFKGVASLVVSGLDFGARGDGFEPRHICTHDIIYVIHDIGKELF